MRESICLALGFFDSVHYGHRQIINRLKSKAQSMNAIPMLSTFSDSFYFSSISKSSQGSAQAKSPQGSDQAKSPQASDQAEFPQASDLAITSQGSESPAKFSQESSLAKSPQESSLAKSPQASDPANYTSKKLVYTLSERKTIINELGISDVLAFDFSPQFSAQHPLEFLKSLLDAHNIRYIVCGYDYRYGAGGRGDIHTLRQFCDANDIQLEVVDKVCLDGDRVSTTRIKALLGEGDIVRANQLLSDTYFVSGRVKSGRGEGRKNSLPTANIDIPDQKLLPRCGVYATETELGGILYPSVTSIGTKPTYNDYSLSVETHIIDFASFGGIASAQQTENRCDIYGEQIKIRFSAFIREIKKFSTRAELARQIALDILTAKK